MIWFSGERGSMAFALAIKTRLDFPKAGDKFLPFTLGFASLTLVSCNCLLGYFIKKFGFDGKNEDIEAQVPFYGNIQKSNITTNINSLSNKNTNNNNTNSKEKNEIELKLQDDSTVTHYKSKRLFNNNMHVNDNDDNTARENGVNNYTNNYDQDKFVLCFDKFKNHLAVIQEKYLLPLVERTDNVVTKVKLPKDSTDNGNQKIPKVIENTDDLDQYDKDTIRISEIAEKVQSIDDISKYNYDISGYLDDEK
jgi:hypothetical protein